MAVRALATDTLLTYEVETEPDPLNVSTPSRPIPGTLIFTISNKDAAVSCRSITFKIPIGDGANDLAELTSPEGIGTVPVGEGAGDWKTRKELQENGTVLAVELTPQIAPIVLPTDWWLTLRVTGFTVNRVEGAVTIGVTEVTTSGTKPTTLDPVIKAPHDFYLRNLTPTPLLVDNGATVTLTWQTGGGDNRTKYTMFWDRESEPVAGTSWTSPPLHQSTGFMLQAEITTPGGATLTHTLTTTATVAPQDLTTRDLVVNRTLDIGNGPGTATTNLGFSTSADGTRHLPTSMVDGNPNTYWWSANHPQANDWVQIDLGSERTLTKVDLLLGKPDGSFRLPEFALECAKEDKRWTQHGGLITQGRADYSATLSVTARYVRLRMTRAHTGGSTYRVAIRSFDITTVPRGAVITPDGTTIYAPLTANAGMTIVGDLLVTGRLDVIDKLTAEATGIKAKVPFDRIDIIRGTTAVKLRATSGNNGTYTCLRDGIAVAYGGNLDGQCRMSLNRDGSPITYVVGLDIKEVTFPVKRGWVLSYTMPYQHAEVDMTFFYFGRE
ncbi:discoidin domain-containing protein [Kitasatospora sp. NPDC004669]|uniref:discoidin domain-containing protein n=1 Tax=Kitasatospora sp. NPDC004669 TaxID=3154555 RepID=UPI0033B8FD0B